MLSEPSGGDFLDQMSFRAISSPVYSSSPVDTTTRFRIEVYAGSHDQYTVRNLEDASIPFHVVATGARHRTGPGTLKSPIPRGSFRSLVGLSP